MKKILGKIRYRWWLLFGGQRTEDGFQLLSQSIIANRKLISEVRTNLKDLERRMWELEGHTPQEELDKIGREIDCVAKKLDESRGAIKSPSGQS